MMKSRTGARKSRSGGADSRRGARPPVAPSSASSPSKSGSGAAERARRKREEAANHCAHCDRDLTELTKALYVEEEVGRVFCSEDCITSHFQPEIQKLEKEYLRFRPESDLSAEERERLDHLRWMTLEQPDEVWREKTLSGDFRYTLVSEFAPDNRRVWSVCICLFLRGEPSFLFVSFPTRSRALVDRFRRGERVEWTKVAGREESVPAGERGFHGNGAADAEGASEPSPRATRKGSTAGGKAGAGRKKGSASGGQQAQGAAAGALAAAETTASPDAGIDGLAGDWTVEETVRARMLRNRRKGDIPPDQFELFEACLQESIESPDEVWSMPLEQVLAAFDPAAVPFASAAPVDADAAGDGEAAAEGDADAEPVNEGGVYVFIKSYTQEARAYWYVAIARDTEEEGQIEVLESFPTRDKGLVDRLRSGTQEYGDDNDLPVYSRMVH